MTFLDALKGAPQKNPLQKVIDEARGDGLSQARKALKQPEPKSDAQKIKEAAEQSRKAATGGKSLAQVSAKKPGTFVFSVNEVRKKAGFKPGSEEDKALKGVLADRVADGKITPEELRRVEELISSGGLKSEYSRLQSRNLDSRRRKAGAQRNLPFSEEAYTQAVSQGLSAVYGRDGNPIPIMEAEQAYKRLGLLPPAVEAETQEAQDMRSRGPRTTFAGMSIPEQEEALQTGIQGVSKSVSEGVNPFMTYVLKAAGQGQAADVINAPARLATELALNYPFDAAQSAVTVFDTKKPWQERVVAGAMTLMDVVPFFGDELLRLGGKGLKELSSMMKAGAYDEVLDSLDLTKRLELEEVVETIAKAPEAEADEALGFVFRQKTKGTPDVPEPDAGVGVSFREPDVKLEKPILRPAEPDIPTPEAAGQNQIPDAGKMVGDANVTQPPKPVDTPTAKEPWQVSLSQYLAANKESFDRRYNSNNLWYIYDKQENKLLLETRNAEIPEKLNTKRYHAFSLEEWKSNLQRSANNEPLDFDTKISNGRVFDSDVEGNLRERHKQNTENALKEGKPVPAEVLADYPDLAKKYGRDANVTQTPKLDAPQEVSPAVKVPDELKGKVDETFLGKKADEWERRLAELQAKPKKPRTKTSGGLDPDVLEEAVLRAGIAVARAGEPVEQAVRSAIKAMGLGDESAEEIRAAVERELGVEPPVRMAQADTAKIRAEKGMPEYQRARQSLDQLKTKSADVDVAKTIKEVLDSPRPMTAAEELASREAFDEGDKIYQDLTGQYNKAVEAGDMAKAAQIEDQLAIVQKDLEELVQAADLAGTEWGRSGRARQLEIQRSREPQVIRYRQYKALGGKPNKAQQQRIDDLVSQLEAEKKARADAEAKAAKAGNTRRRARAEGAVKTVRPPKKIDELIKQVDDEFAEWQKRWAKAGTGSKEGGGTTIPLAFEGAYLIAKGQMLRGVRTLDEIVSAVRKAGITKEDISDEDLYEQFYRASVDIKRPAKPKEKPTLAELRGELAKKTGRVKERRKAPKAKAEGNAPKTKEGNRYIDTLGRLQKETERLQAQVSLLRAADPEGEDWMKLADDVRRLSAGVNRGRAYGKDVLQVGNIGFEGDEVAKLRESLDNLKRDFGFDDQSINAPGPSYENIIKNIEDVEAGNLPPKAKQERLKELYRVLNQGRTEGEGFFMDGKSAIEDPLVARARAREDAVMAKINKELAAQKRQAEREAMGAAQKIGNDVVKVFGVVKTLALSGEAGFLGRQAWMPLMGGRFKVAGRAVKDALNSIKEEAFDWTVADLKSSPWYDKAEKSGLALTDPSSAVREEDFTADLLGEIADQAKNKAVKSVAGGLQKYADVNERLYTSFLNRVRLDLFEEFAEAAGRHGPLTDKDFEGFAIIINDMTGRTNVPPKAEAAVSVVNNLLISSRYYLSRLKLASGTSLYAGGSKAARAQMAKEYARYVGTYSTLLAVANWANEEFDLGIEIGKDPRGTNFGNIKLPNGVSIELGAGIRPFSNLLSRNLAVRANDLMLKTGKDRTPVYITGAGREARDTEFFAKPESILMSFLKMRANPIPRLLLSDFSTGKAFGIDTNIYRETATSATPIIGKNVAERAMRGVPADAQVMAFLLEFFGLGGGAGALDYPGNEDKEGG